MPKPFLSAVITCLNEEGTIEGFVDSLVGALDRTQLEYEIILVNDGSADRTFEIIARLLNRHDSIRVGLDLMKNSGQAAAVTAGMAEAWGDYVLMMDSDLQLFPEDVDQLIGAAKDGADIVNGCRRPRHDPFLRKLFSAGGNWVMKRVAGTELGDLGCTYRLVDRRLIQAFELGPRRILSIPLLISRAGRIAEVAVRHRARPHGRSGWTLRKLWGYQADNMVVLAEPVFQWIALTSLAFAVLLVVRVALDPVLHWSLLGSITPGLILNAIAAAALVEVALLCVIGEFVVRCHRSVLARPAYVVRKRISRPDTASLS
jgi:undecaprenyl-phosphate 4-deoxy-4-formamido-L-arabinose transferase